MYAKKEFMYYPIILALSDLNFIYKSKYYDSLLIEHKPIFVSVAKEFINEKKASMNKYEKIRYRLYRKIKGIKMGSEYSGVYKRRHIHESKGYYNKDSYAWEVGNLYFNHIDYDEAMS